jgi:three-Cys-motif partner protein
MTNQQFGGDWTVEKLERIREYLYSYLKALKNTNFTKYYVDAFAGTGYNLPKQKAELYEPDISELTEQDTKNFLDGSARIALQLNPRFDKYVFIEKSPVRFAELQNLTTEFPELKSAISLVNQDANEYIRLFCRKMGKFDRAVIFLDPFGMQVQWETIEVIANTEKIDLWYLFPIGMGVNRMLKKDANISDAWKEKLIQIFGTTDWYEAFYIPEPQLKFNLYAEIPFEESFGMIKDADFDDIKAYIIKRLKSIFNGVAKNPLLLRNSKGSPLYLLCFASGNKKGSKIALEIAEHILKP